MTTWKTPLLVSLLAKSQQLSISQRVIHVDSFQVSGGQQAGCSLGGTPSLPHGVATPIMPPTHSSQAAALWSWGRQPSSLYFNKSFFSTHGMVFIWQFLTKTWNKLQSLPRYLLIIEETLQSFKNCFILLWTFSLWCSDMILRTRHYFSLKCNEFY
jgi:hypothetical protein